MYKKLYEYLNQLKAFLQRNFKKYDTKLPYIITSIIALIVFVGGTKIFIELTESLKTKLLAKYDQAIIDTVVSWRDPALTKYFILVTDIGDSIGYLIVFSLCTLSFYLIFKNWKYVAQIALVMVLALSSNLLLKKFINRARPDAEYLVQVETLSYPSGHAMMSMAFYGFLIYLIYNFKINKLLKTGIICFLVLLIGSIGLSRIYLGVHFPSDVAGGYLAGLIWVVFCVFIFNLIKIFRRDPSA